MGETMNAELNNYHLCVRCQKTDELNNMIETERGLLCNECDCYRLECLNNVECKQTIEEFWNEAKMKRNEIINEIVENADTEDLMSWAWEHLTNYSTEALKEELKKHEVD